MVWKKVFLLTGFVFLGILLVYFFPVRMLFESQKRCPDNIPSYVYEIDRNFTCNDLKISQSGDYAKYYGRFTGVIRNRGDVFISFDSKLDNDWFWLGKYSSVPSGFETPVYIRKNNEPVSKSMKLNLDNEGLASLRKLVGSYGELHVQDLDSLKNTLLEIESNEERNIPESVNEDVYEKTMNYFQGCYGKNSDTSFISFPIVCRRPISNLTLYVE